MPSELSERLRHFADKWRAEYGEHPHSIADVICQAADRIDELEAEVEAHRLDAGSITDSNFGLRTADLLRAAAYEIWQVGDRLSMIAKAKAAGIPVEVIEPTKE